MAEKSQNVVFMKRLPIELQNIQKSYANHGITCTPVEDDNYTHLEATIPGPKDTPFEGGIFKIDIMMNSNYPFTPPIFNFVTPMFHPNIDKKRAICLDSLRLPPIGCYVPTLGIQGLLLSIQCLLATPNAHDPLNREAGTLYINSPEFYNEKVLELVRQHATPAKTEMQNSEAANPAS